MEEFRAIEDYEGLYEVSNYGNVKSLAREDALGRKLKEIILKPSANNRGYLFVGLHKGGVRKSKDLHILVAIAFLRHKPNGYEIVVDHIDNEKQNNKLENLQIISHRENCSKDKKGGSSKYVGVNIHKSKNKWMARISINGKRKYLGSFVNEIEASKAYQSQLKQMQLS
tara:strand:- start:42 stop:548 length:507 start_codon:yes stop_codon:yes gene_type:complete